MTEGSANLAPLTSTRGPSWPAWARRLASLAIVVHLTSIVAAELATAPTSPLERAVADLFAGYYQAIDQGHGHRFYSDIGPTPILTAELRFGDGRPNRTVRIPDRSVRPRLVYQRQLALANSVFEEVRSMPSDPDAESHPQSKRAESFARHLCHENPGCTGVTLRLQLHLNPHPARLIEAGTVPGAAHVDPDADEFYTTPQVLGEFPCPPQ